MSSLTKSPDDLAAFLVARGFDVKTYNSGAIRYRLRSPWNPDEKTPSAYIYESGVLKDYSTGKSGNILTFKKMFGADFEVSLSSYVPPPPRPKKPFKGQIPDYYLDITKEEADRIDQYALSRKITEGYLKGATKFEGIRKLCMVYPYQDNGVVVGAKFRTIEAGKDRMRLRGCLGLYILGNGPFRVLVEGEANANSLYMWYKDQGINATVASSGAVSTPPTWKADRVMIDFDGDDAKYNDRILKWGHLGTPVKLRLPKGEDINSLYVKGSLGLVGHLLV